MNSFVLKLSFFAVIALLISSCCTTQVVEYQTKIYKPIYKPADEIRNGVKVSSVRNLKNTGKIYSYGNYILINERKEGIHIVDNSDPASPVFKTFIEIPGNGDMAVRNNILYADSYVDLVALDISNPMQPVVVKRIENIFPNSLNIEGMGFEDPEKGILVDVIEVDTTIRYTYKDCGSSPVMSDSRDFNSGGAEVGGAKGGGNVTGIGGSMARLTILNNYLYSVDRSNLQVFDIQNASDPKVWSKVSIGWDIETIFPFKDKLFIGSMTGMFIYDVSTPWSPQLLGQFSHARACDPVVANDKFAFVTLRTGTACGGNQNQLDVLDISDITRPKLVKTYPMQGPNGLGLDKNVLFICDGAAGLKVFDVTTPESLQLLNWQAEIKTFDVIPLGYSLLMIGDDGFYQYDYSDPKNLRLLSKIPVVK